MSNSVELKECSVWVRDVLYFTKWEKVRYSLHRSSSMFVKHMSKLSSLILPTISSLDVLSNSVLLGEGIVGLCLCEILYSECISFLFSFCVYVFFKTSVYLLTITVIFSLLSLLFSFYLCNVSLKCINKLF